MEICMTGGFTVAKLIEALQTLPPDFVVRHDDDTRSRAVTRITVFNVHKEIEFS